MNDLATPTKRDFDIEDTTVALLNKSEIEQQIATARKFPRSVKRFLDNALEMVTLSESIAQECIYSLPRDGKVIEGPSARFAEIIVSAWGNSRAGARVVNENGGFVTAQGVFHDLEHNTAITFEVQRRIVSNNGKRYSHDMIGVTANAACSIALRNAILKGVPKAFWADLYAAARRTVMGDFKTLPSRRAAAFEQFQAYGIDKAKIYTVLGIKGQEDIGLEHLVTLGGMLTALKDGDTTPEELLAKAQPTPEPPPPPPAPADTGPLPPPPPKPVARGPREPVVPRDPEQKAAFDMQAPPAEAAPPHDPETGEVLDDGTPIQDGGSFLANYDAKIADWEVRLKAASDEEQGELWECEIAPVVEDGNIMPPDLDRLKGLLRNTG
jgi:hypothetical protein